MTRYMWGMILTLILLACIIMFGGIAHASEYKAIDQWKMNRPEEYQAAQDKLHEIKEKQRQAKELEEKKQELKKICGQFGDYRPHDDFSDFLYLYPYYYGGGQW